MKTTRGSISIFVLIMGVIFSITIGGMVMFGSLEYTNSRRSESYGRAVDIAEAGINYYRWHLAHDMTDYTDGTGNPGPYVHDYTDPQTGQVTGQFSLEITPPEPGSQVVTVKSIGASSQHPTIRRSVTVRFGAESLTAFSFLHNASVWFGQGIMVSGEVFSNGGIRMDGTHDSLVKTSKATYTCGTETGCWPPQQKPGVWGNGGPQELWQFPVPAFDFDSIVTDFNSLNAESQVSGVYYGPSGAFGYHLIFKADGTVDVYKVTAATSRRGWNADDVCEVLFQTITNEQLLGNYNVEDKKLFYFEDTVWVEGTVKGKASVVAARLPVESYSTNIWINDNLVYEAQDGSTVLGLIAQSNIYFAYDIPQDFVINATMIAQNGRVMRHHYNRSGCSSGNKAVRDSLAIFGSLVTKEKSYWNFTGSGVLRSGFVDRIITYNQNALDGPPPYFPTTGVVKILSWEEDVAN